jgi:hypothetical protein
VAESDPSGLFIAGCVDGCQAQGDPHATSYGFAEVGDGTGGVKSPIEKRREQRQMAVVSIQRQIDGLRGQVDQLNTAKSADDLYNSELQSYDGDSCQTGLALGHAVQS